ncbi:1-phosphofructokinase [Bacillus andreraoultii]|uniref:1-phosphofructokinase n=1 Tax=Bacillus andreraoultii TaxID=1499685 RepID=UPI000539782A|nr:1-phosphofructokinase [Bacillus andreraoultii]
MIYTVTLNPSVDYIVHVQNVKLGELNRMETDYKYPGGKGINVSRILHELKSETVALGFIGGFTGEFIEKWLKKDGLSTDFTHITGDTRINIKLKSNQETEINGIGPEITKEEASALLDRFNQITNEDTIILSGSKPPSLPTDYYKKIVEIVNRKKAEFVIDTTSKELLEILPYHPLLVKPNLEELSEIFSIKMNNREDIIKYGKKLLEAGAKNVIVSMGGEGALLLTSNAVYEGMSPKGTVKNSVGAGDSLIAGFISRYVETSDVVSSFQFGLASGSATAFSSDLAKGEDILALLNQVKVNQL